MDETINLPSDIRRLEAVIFDMDGVLVDSEPLHMIAIQKVLKKIGYVYSLKELERFIGVRDIDMWHTLIRERQMQITAEILTDMRLEIADEVFNRETIRPVVGIPEFMSAIRAKGLKMGIATSTARSNAEFLLRLLGFEELFDVIVTGSDIQQPKPNPEPYLKAAMLLGVAPQGCLAVEDSTHGIRAAKAAGCYTIAYASPSAIQQDTTPADLVVKHISEIHLDQISGMHS